MPPLVRRCGRFLRLLLAGLGALVLLVTLAPPRAYLRWLTGPWNDPRAPVLIVLGGDSLDGKMLGESSYWRTIYAIWTWREGGFKHVILSGDQQITLPMRDYLVCQGVPAGAVIVEGRSRSTRENALFTAELLRGIPGPYVLLTSDFHMWRARRAFTRAGVTVLPLPFPDAGKRMVDWRWRWNVFLDLSAETVKIAYYRARGWI